RFSRILFRPNPIKVQTRELNQLQTILQDQIEKMEYKMQQLNLNRRPYWDDWNPEKRFSRILFRPNPIKVQTRELNQLQTILQDQIEK
ncbi:hypothetical protein CQA65_30375, partial [Klebsiella pneumoniae]